MQKMKKFFLYFLMLIALYIFVTVLTNFEMTERFKDITNNCETTIKSPKIEIEECKATNSQVYLKGKITNDTGEHIPIKYLQIDIYNENDAYLGTEFKELKYFNVNETVAFDLNYKYNNVEKIVIGITDKTVKEKREKEVNTVAGVKIEPEITEETIRIATPIGIVLSLNTLLGAF